MKNKVLSIFLLLLFLFSTIGLSTVYANSECQEDFTSCMQESGGEDDAVECVAEWLDCIGYDEPIQN